MDFFLVLSCNGVTVFDIAVIKVSTQEKMNRQTGDRV